MEQLMTLQWDSFVSALDELPNPTPKRTETIQAGQAFLDRILRCDLSAEFLLDVTDETVQAAWDIATSEQSESDPLIDMAQMNVDDSVWERMVEATLRLPSMCDPSVAEVFL